MEARADLRAVQGELFNPDEMGYPDTGEVVKARITRNGKRYNAIFAKEYLGANFSVRNRSAAGEPLMRDSVAVLKLTAISDPHGAFANALLCKRQLDNSLYIYDMACDKNIILRRVERPETDGKSRVLKLLQERKELNKFMNTLRYKLYR